MSFIDRAVIAGLLPTVTLGATVTDVRLDPPSSLEPPGQTALVSFEHRSRVTKSCEERDGWCWERSVVKPQVPSLHVQLVPIREPRLGRKDERQPSELTIPAGPAPEHVDLPLALGDWEVRVPHGHARRVRLREGESPTIEIWTLIGACVRDQQRCLLRADAVRQFVRPPR